MLTHSSINNDDIYVVSSLKMATLNVDYVEIDVEQIKRVYLEESFMVVLDWVESVSENKLGE